jgi:uncharacterized protein YjdB
MDHSQISRPVSLVDVEFTVTSGGGTITIVGGGPVSSAVQKTAETGRISLPWALGPTAGAQTVTARIVGGASSAVVVFTATASAAAGSLVLSPDGAQLIPGERATFTAARTDGAGVPLTNPTFEFSTLDPGLIRIDGYSGGSVTVAAVAVGSARLVAMSSGKGDTVVVRVNAAPPAAVASITLTPETATVAIGGTQPLTAITRDAQNNVLTGRAITYSSSSNAVATVSTTGVVTAVAAGTADVTATSEGRTATSRITVPASACAAGAVCTVTISTNLDATSVRVGHTLLFQAILHDAAGTQITTGATVSYATSNGGVATVTAVPQGTPGFPAGYFANIGGVATGQVTITVTANGRSASKVITVVP